jgi:hypothetical protein
MCHNRLLLIGPARELKRFDRSAWKTKARARYIDILECSATRLAFQFETTKAPTQYIKAASLNWPKLIFLLDYEIEEWCIKGLAKARRGELESCIVNYAS